MPLACSTEPKNPTDISLAQNQVYKSAPSNMATLLMFHECLFMTNTRRCK